MTCDKIPAWQFAGEVVKVDGRQVLDQAPNGASPIFTVDMIKKAESEIGRSLGTGDVVLYWSRYDDAYDKPGPAVPASSISRWPAPRPPSRRRTSTRRIMSAPKVFAPSALTARASAPSAIRTIRCAAPQSFFQNPKALESHLGLFKHGGIDFEGLMNLDKVPNGAFFVALPVKHYHPPTVESRAAAITDPELA